MAPRGSITDRTLQLGRALQASGVHVSLSELIDAATAAGQIDIGQRHQLATALRSTLVKDSRHYPAFELAFERYFPLRPASERAASARALEPAGVAAAVAADDDLVGVAAALVDAHGGLDAGARTEKHHLQRVFLGADIARLMSRVRVADPDLSPALIRARVDELKRLIGIDVRAQLDLTDLPDVDAGLSDLDFLDASRAELEQMRQAIRPIARKLAARIARRRASSAGRVNIRRTMRRSLDSGGVPIDVRVDRRRAHKPELFVLCDISGSVADFSLFTLTLMSAISAELARTRSFVFVDDVDEVTDLLAGTSHGIEPWSLLRNANVIGVDGHSDYGAVLERFWHEVGDRDVHRTSTVIITGDARTNHRRNGVEWLQRIGQRARKVYWSNPEPRDDWNTYDSEIAVYSQHCAACFEVRNIRQLVTTVEQLF